MSRLAKSGIEHVILAGSSRFYVARSKILISPGRGYLPGTRNARFFKDLDFFGSENANFCSPAGVLVLRLPKDWYGLGPGSLSIGNILED